MTGSPIFYATWTDIENLRCIFPEGGEGRRAETATAEGPMAESSLVDTCRKDIEAILEGQDDRFERLAGKLDAQNWILKTIAERLESIDEHIQGNANLLWRIEAALVVQRRRLDAIERGSRQRPRRRNQGASHERADRDAEFVLLRQQCDAAEVACATESCESRPVR